MAMKAENHQLWAEATRPGLCLRTNSPGQPRHATTSRIMPTILNDRLPTMLGALAFLWLMTHAHFADTHKLDGCTFPSKWAGRWFQSGVIQQIVIEGDRLSSKGKCLSSEGDKFLLVDEKGCYRCVVIHEKHINVLQYKETYCLSREALPNACSLITGDALLYSMFRENATPEKCPLIGPFSFTYNRGHGDCKSPVSSIESCTEESRLLLNYQACPDVHGSESAVEELECLATWKEGSLRYLVGKVHHNHATSNEDRYRCFVYEKTNGIGSHSLAKEGDGVEYRVAQSGDATCNGLFSATEGSRTMALKRVPLTWKCKFPSWMTFPGHWHTLDYSSTYSFHQKNEILRITNQTGADIKVHCAHVKATSPTGNSVALVAHWQHHCVGRYVCLAFHRRGAHAAELQAGRFSPRPEDACSSLYFQPLSTPYLTLVTTNPEARDCPYSGKFSIAGLKILQRNIRSLLKLPDSTHITQNITATNNDGRNHKKMRKHNHRKHKHSGKQEDFDNAKMVAERKRKKYETFLEKVFTKEKAREEKRIKKLMEIESNSTMAMMSMKGNVADYWNDSQALNISSLHLLRSRRSSANTERVPCVSNDYTMLDIGCNSQQNMEFHSSCDNKDFITAYSCHGVWTENGTSFLITTPLTRDSIGAKRYCFIYRESPDRMIHFTRSSVSCDRNIRPGIDGALVFNASTLGECMETSKASGLRVFRWTELLDCLFLHCIILVSHFIISR